MDTNPQIGPATPVPTPATPQPAAPVRRFDTLHMVLLALVAILLTLGIGYWVFTVYLFPSEFRPVTLSAKEEQALDAKLERLESLDSGRPRARKPDQLPAEPLEPEAYTEKGASREVTFTEKEVNALLANNTDLARKLAIDLADDLVSAKLLVPMDPDFPILGGKILKVRAGVELAYRDGKPVVVLKGISLMGVPLPNAWIGGIKNIDLVQEFGNDKGFWKSFADGVEDIHVEEGQLKIQLKE